ncbi:ABC transporter ATP-binding protein [Xanthobacter dioxanivorans]|uniref:ABC transporter ATP-binding protein n=1 Tax=Xanthobacter dioxanivorans TaxID=2528964 RepID=A0A974PPF9_9HYPH|nr:ABC transporter ATP-binding protein [Xanthobacter dioxanivorans]QRG06919.1 ABC transporter ATP-binding protein [Xanthobacter dioxanivorans]
MNAQNITPRGQAVAQHTLISIEAVSKGYGTGNANLAVGSVDLQVGRGEFLSIVGPSGCGKSTLLKIIAGLVPQSSGTILIDGRPVQGPPAKLVYLFQQYAKSLFPWLTVEQNVAFGLDPTVARSKAERHARCMDLLGKVGLAASAQLYPYQLSGGMQQRVAIARALAADPKVLLLDEPFSSVDALTRLELHDLVLSLWESTDLTVVLVTHDVEEAIYLSDRVAVLGPRPSTVTHSYHTDLPRPRDPVATPAMERYQLLRIELLERLLSGRRPKP